MFLQTKKTMLASGKVFANCWQIVVSGIFSDKERIFQNKLYNICYVDARTGALIEVLLHFFL